MPFGRWVKLRIKNHPILEFERGNPVEFVFDGRRIPAFDNETIAVSLHGAGVRTLSVSFEEKRPRGFYCAIGNCSSCMMVVDGVPNVKTCVTLVKNGMVVETQKSRGSIL